MLTIWVYAAAAILLLAFLNWMPGVKVLVSPVIGLVTKLVEEVFKHSIGYIIWLCKLIYESHFEVVKHILHNREYFNPADDFDGKGL